MSAITRPEAGFRATVPELLRRAVGEYGDRELIVTPEVRATVRSIEHRSRRLAKQLLGGGVGKGAHVGLQFAFGPEQVAAFLAATRIGAIAIPLNTGYAPGELRRSLRRMDVHTLLAPEQLLGRSSADLIEQAIPEVRASSMPLLLTELPNLRQVWLFGETRRPWCSSRDIDATVPGVSDEMLANAEDDVTPADRIAIVQTSGSTAEPKGVVFTHGAVINKMAGPLMALDDPGCPHSIYAAMPLFWVGGLITLAAALAHGSTLVGQERFSAEVALDLIERERCMGIWAWVGVLDALKAHPSLPARDMSCIPMLTEPVVDPTYRPPMGMTETIGLHMVTPHPDHGAELPAHLRGSNGATAPHYEHKLVDELGNEIIGDGEGEIWVRGYAMLDGMYKRERHEVFEPDGWYRTGDRARRVGDLFFFTGRLTEMIKTNGNNVAPLEVESVLRRHESVSEAYVLGVPDERRGEIVVAIVVPLDGAVIDVDEVRGHLERELSAFKVPRVLIAMEASQVPRLGSGKASKRAMRQVVESMPVPRHGSSAR